MKAWMIVNWHERHENHDSKKVANSLSFRTERRLRGTAEYNRLRRLPNYRALLGAYDLLKDITMQLPRQQRGWILDPYGRPLDAQSLADETDDPAEQWEQDLAALQQAGWIQLAELPSQAEPGPEADGTLWQPREQAQDVVGEEPEERAVAGRRGAPRAVAGDRPPILYYITSEHTKAQGDSPGRTDPVNSSRAHRADTGTGASEPRKENRTGADRLRRTGPEREAELINRLTAAASVADFDLQFDDWLKSLTGAMGVAVDADNKRNLHHLLARIRGHPRRGELAGRMLYKLVTTFEWIRRGHHGDPWAIWQAWVNELLEEAKVA